MKEIQTILNKGIYPLEEGEVLYGYTDIEEAKRDYKELTGEELDVENCQELKVMAFENDNGTYFTWKDQSEGEPSLVLLV